MKVGFIMATYQPSL